MVDNGWFSGGIDYYYANIWDDWWVELANGDAGMVMSGTWTFCCTNEFFDEAGQEWDWAPLPMFNAAAGEYNYELATGSTVSINRASDHPDEAAMFLDFWLSDPVRVLDIASVVGFGEYLVPLHFAAEDFPEGTDERIARFFADFATVTGGGRFGYTTWTFWPAAPNVQLWTDIEGVWAGDISIEEYWEVHQQLWDAARAEGETLAIPAP
jgi:raffinose/stachyose/melibiose transport system substrate-binding protein